MSRRLLFLTICSILIFPVYAWESNLALNSSKNPVILSEASSFSTYSLELYDKIGESSLNFEAFQFALKGYIALNSEEQLTKTKYLTIIDMSRSANLKRFFIINMDTYKLEHKSLVAHGRASGGEFANKFSNIKNSHQTSLGFYKTAETYQGKHGFSLRLDGLENSNDNARERAIVIHSAAYAGEEFINKNGRLGRSYGCPSLPKQDYNIIVDKIKNGTCLYIYYPSKTYLDGSNILNSKATTLALDN